MRLLSGDNLPPFTISGYSDSVYANSTTPIRLPLCFKVGEDAPPCRP